jgi:multicomponent Na+:H+ antiporter subunit G
MNAADWLAQGRDAIAAALVALGLAFGFVSALGVVRFPDFYTRVHAGKLAGALAAPLVIIGLGVHAFEGALALKLAILAGTVFLLAAPGANLLASAAHGAGLTPVSGAEGARPGRRQAQRPAR